MTGYLAFDPGGRRLAVASAFQVSIVDVRTGTVLLGLGPLERKVNALAFSLDGRRLAAGCFNGGVYVWNTPGARRLVPDTQANSVTNRAYILLEKLKSEHLNLDEVVIALEARKSHGNPKVTKRAYSLACNQRRMSEVYLSELNLGDLLMRPGCPAAWYEWALEVIEKKLAAENEETWRANFLANKAQALYHLGRYKKSLKYADQACNISIARGTDVRKLNSCLFKALSLLRVHRRQEALETHPECVNWLRAHGSDEPLPAMYNLHARRIARQPGRTEAEYGEALDWARCACGPDKNPIHRITRGLCLYRLKRYDEALKAVDSAAGCHGSDPTLTSATRAAVSCLCHHARGDETRALIGYNRLLVLRHSFEIQNDPEVISLFKEAKRALNR